MVFRVKYVLKTLMMTALLAVVLSSCVFSKKINYLQTRDDLPQYNDSIEFSDYKLQRGDYLYVYLVAIDEDMMEMFNGNSVMYANNTTYYNSDNPTARLYLYLIGEDDCIEYPYLGRLKVVGLTVREVKNLLETKLAEMINGFSVDVRLANRSFSILGEAGSGKYIIPKEKLTIFEALAMSGDLKAYSRRSKIQIIRKSENGTIVKTFDIRTRSIIDSEFYYIQPNDVIYVPFSDAKVMGADHVTSVISLTMSTVSFGLLIYSIVNSIIKATE